MNAKPKNTDEYIASFTGVLRQKLDEIRRIIRKAAPGAEEVISYNMPAFKQHGVLVYFAANKAHIGLYPTASPITFFSERLNAYNTSKGAIRFPLDEPLPAKLIADIVRYRVKEDKENAAKKK